MSIDRERFTIYDADGCSPERLHQVAAPAWLPEGWPEYDTLECDRLLDQAVTDVTPDEGVGRLSAAVEAALLHPDTRVLRDLLGRSGLDGALLVSAAVEAGRLPAWVPVIEGGARWWGALCERATREADEARAWLTPLVIDLLGNAVQWSARTFDISEAMARAEGDVREKITSEVYARAIGPLLPGERLAGARARFGTLRDPECLGRLLRHPDLVEPLLTEAPRALLTESAQLSRVIEHAVLLANKGRERAIERLLGDAVVRRRVRSWMTLRAVQGWRVPPGLARRAWEQGVRPSANEVDMVDLMLAESQGAGERSLVAICSDAALVAHPRLEVAIHATVRERGDCVAMGALGRSGVARAWGEMVALLAAEVVERGAEEGSQLVSELVETLGARPDGAVIERETLARLLAAPQRSVRLAASRSAGAVEPEEPGRGRRGRR